MIYIK